MMEALLPSCQGREHSVMAEWTAQTGSLSTSIASAASERGGRQPAPPHQMVRPSTLVTYLIQAEAMSLFSLSA